MATHGILAILNFQIILIICYNNYVEILNVLDKIYGKCREL